MNTAVKTGCGRSGIRATNRLGLLLALLLAALVVSALVLFADHVGEKRVYKEFADHVVNSANAKEQDAVLASISALERVRGMRPECKDGTQLYNPFDCFRMSVYVDGARIAYKKGVDACCLQPDTNMGFNFADILKGAQDSFGWRWGTFSSARGVHYFSKYGDTDAYRSVGQVQEAVYALAVTVRDIEQRGFASLEEAKQAYASAVAKLERDVAFAQVQPNPHLPQ